MSESLSWGLAAAEAPAREGANYEDWCRASFGTSFAEHFMLVYARKVWTVEPRELTLDWLGSKVGGRISRPDLEQVVRGAIDARFQELMYFYDPEVPFFRVSFPHRFAASNAPPGQSAISCEVAYSRRKPLPGEALTDRVLEALHAAGILLPNDVVTVRHEFDVPFAYVVFDAHRASAVETIHAWLRAHDVIPCGRFGEWGYHWSFEAIASGQRAAEEVRQ